MSSGRMGNVLKEEHFEVCVRNALTDISKDLKHVKAAQRASDSRHKKIGSRRWIQPLVTLLKQLKLLQTLKWKLKQT